MSSMPMLSENIKRARRRLDEIPEVTIIDDWVWDKYTEQFCLHIRIELGQCYDSIPQNTQWYITAESIYPAGTINVYPSVHNGIIDTYPHQQNNAIIEKNNLWRRGKLCVALSTLSLGLGIPEKEPYTIDERLYWNVKRAVLWLYAAATDMLISKGDFFESPDFVRSQDHTLIAFIEDSVSMFQWEDTELRYGVAGVYNKKLLHSELIASVQSFHSIDKKECIYLPHWGTFIQPKDDERLDDALWIKLSAPPVIKKWQAPTTLGELCEACKVQGIDFMEILKSFAYRARDGRAHFVLFGYPIPVRVGEQPSEFSWQGLKLPVLSNGSYTNRGFHSGKRKNGGGPLKGTPAGFRPGELGWWLNDEQSILKDNMPLEWITSQNWSSRTISSRGQLPGTIRGKQIAVIGVGSLGSIIAELLVRAGVTCLTCIDGEFLNIGNLCRHTLTVNDVFRNKSEAVAERLQLINPNVVAQGIVDYLTMSEGRMLKPDLSKYDIIIDTTGDDYVLDLLSAGHYKNDIVFYSVSVGLGARRMYLCLQRTSHPDVKAFISFAEPYFEHDRDDCDLDSLPRDGVGCWHPLFPARCDDMWMAASCSIKVLESFLSNTTEKSLYAIYETNIIEGLFCGYQPVKVKHYAM